MTELSLKRRNLRNLAGSGGAVGTELGTTSSETMTNEGSEDGASTVQRERVRSTGLYIYIH